MRLKHLIAIVLCVFMTSLKTLAQPYISYVDIGEFNERNLYSSEYLYTINLPVGGCDLDNSVEFDRFISILSDILENSYSELIGVYVCGATSPDGLWQDNVNLSEKRTREAVELIRRRTGISSDLIHSKSLNEDWDYLYELVENSYLPHREEVLDIISTKKWGERKSALWKVGDGEVWDILMDEFFPLMRGIRVAVFCQKNENDEDSVEEIQEEADVLPFSPVDEKEFPVIQVDTVYVTDTVYVFKEVPVAKNARSPWLMGLKTNILTDAVAVPSFGLELQLAERLSLDLQGWYGFHNILYRSAQTDIYGFSPELRWWFADRAMEKGHFIGVSGVCSWYTLEWLDGYLYQNGLEGDFCIDAGNSSPAWSAGLVYGYSLGLGRKARWGLEFTLGFGYASYSQNVGEWNEDAASWLYHSHQNNHHIGITELSVNLTYRFSLRKFDPAYYDAR